MASRCLRQNTQYSFCTCMTSVFAASGGKKGPRGQQYSILFARGVVIRSDLHSNRDHLLEQKKNAVSMEHFCASGFNLAVLDASRTVRARRSLATGLGVPHRRDSAQVLTDRRCQQCTRAYYEHRQKFGNGHVPKRRCRAPYAATDDAEVVTAVSQSPNFNTVLHECVSMDMKSSESRR
jgi:hypothetical protein